MTEVTEYGKVQTSTTVDDTVMWAKGKLENFGNGPSNNPLCSHSMNTIFRIHAGGIDEPGSTRERAQQGPFLRQCRVHVGCRPIGE